MATSCHFRSRPLSSSSKRRNLTGEHANCVNSCLGNSQPRSRFRQSAPFTRCWIDINSFTQGKGVDTEHKARRSHPDDNPTTFGAPTSKGSSSLETEGIATHSLSPITPQGICSCAKLWSRSGPRRRSHALKPCSKSAGYRTPSVVTMEFRLLHPTLCSDSANFLFGGSDSGSPSRESSQESLNKTDDMNECISL